MNKIKKLVIITLSCAICLFVPQAVAYAADNNIVLSQTYEEIYTLDQINAPYVSVSEEVSTQLQKQMSKKYVASDEITIVDPGTQIARTYEGHSNYATYGGWNTTINSQSSNISKGSTYKMAGSGSGYLTTPANHIVRLYDVWTSNLKINITIL